MLGDFNTCNITGLLSGIHQRVTCQTHINKTIDLCYSNTHDNFENTRFGDEIKYVSFVAYTLTALLQLKTDQFYFHMYHMIETFVEVLIIRNPN